MSKCIHKIGYLSFTKDCPKYAQLCEKRCQREDHPTANHRIISQEELLKQVQQKRETNIALSSEEFKVLTQKIDRVSEQFIEFLKSEAEKVKKQIVSLNEDNFNDSYLMRCISNSRIELIRCQDVGSFLDQSQNASRSIAGKEEVERFRKRLEILKNFEEYEKQQNHKMNKLQYENQELIKQLNEQKAKPGSSVQEKPPLKKRTNKKDGEKGDKKTNKKDDKEDNKKDDNNSNAKPKSPKKTKKINKDKEMPKQTERKPEKNFNSFFQKEEQRNSQRKSEMIPERTPDKIPQIILNTFKFSSNSENKVSEPKMPHIGEINTHEKRTSQILEEQQKQYLINPILPQDFKSPHQLSANNVKKEYVKTENRNVEVIRYDYNSCKKGKEQPGEEQLGEQSLRKQKIDPEPKNEDNVWKFIESGCFDVHSENNIRASEKIQEEVNEGKSDDFGFESKMDEEKEVKQDISEPDQHYNYSKEYGKQFKKRQ